MSDEIEETEEAVKLAFQPNGLKLMSSSYYSYSSSSTQTAEFLRVKKEIEAKMEAGEPVYVQIRDERRKGSIGRLKSADFFYRPAGSTSGYSWGSRYDQCSVSNIEVVWDGRKNSCKPYAHEVEYLPDWEGGTVWNWTKGEATPKPPRVIPYDHLGQEIESGQFVCFVHRRYGNISMKFGTVTRLTDKGGVFVKTLKLRDHDSAGTEVKALHSSDLIIVNDKLMSRLMMARLSAD